jgi:hypothetical protein
MCVILYTEINGKKILAKNRDGYHVPQVEIIHEIVNNIEVVYLKDKVTGWVEGMTENGTGIINSTLNENTGGKRILLGKKKTNFIYHLLCQSNNKNYIIDYINKHHQYLKIIHFPFLTVVLLLNPSSAYSNNYASPQSSSVMILSPSSANVRIMAARRFLH